MSNKLYDALYSVRGLAKRSLVLEDSESLVTGYKHIITVASEALAASFADKAAPGSISFHTPSEVLTIDTSGVITWRGQRLETPLAVGRALTELVKAMHTEAGEEWKNGGLDG